MCAAERFVQAEFAADLAAVLRGEAAPEYGEAGEFFRRTYMTEGLRDLVVNGIQRLDRRGWRPGGAAADEFRRRQDA